MVITVGDVLIYILDRGEMDQSQFILLIKEEFSTEVRENVMTIAEQIRREGIKEEKLIIAKRLLSEKMEKALVSKITELSLEQIKKLKEKLH